MPKQKWEVKTIYDATDETIADMLNKGWKMIGMCSNPETVRNVYTDLLDFETTLVMTFKRKVKPTPSVYEPQRVYADDPIFGEALEEVLAVSPQGELWVIGDDAGVSDFRYQIRIHDYTVTYAKFEHCLGWLKEYVSSLKSAPYTLTDKAKQLLEGE